MITKGWLYIGIVGTDFAEEKVRGFGLGCSCLV